jgi:hypothetical protein
MHVIFHYFHRVNPKPILISNPLEQLFYVLRYRPYQHPSAVFGNPHKVLLRS